MEMGLILYYSLIGAHRRYGTVSPALLPPHHETVKTGEKKGRDVLFHIGCYTFLFV